MSTKAPIKMQAKTPTAPAAARIPQPPLAEPEHEAERPDIAAQLEGAARLGHSLGAVGVDSSPPPIMQRQEIPEEEEEELQLKREPAAVQRQELPEEEEEELMLKPEEGWVGSQGGPVPPAVEDAIHRARGGGQPMEGALQEQMSASLGHDFSGVRVHTDSEANDLNRRLSAKAFTTGSDIFFKRGVYEPGSSSGRELIAHELSHVVQQSSGRVNGDGSGMTVRPAGEAFEHEADRGAEAVTRSTSNSVQDQTTQAQYEGPDLLALQRAVASPADILALQRTVGNRAVQRLLDPRQGSEAGINLEDKTASRIYRARGGGQIIECPVQAQMGGPLGYDFTGVRAHTWRATDGRKQKLQAKAFTAGPDIFFKRGVYDLRSSSGRELNAREHNHVQQKGKGTVSRGVTDMTVSPAGDPCEQSAEEQDRNMALQRTEAHHNQAQRIVQRNNLLLVPIDSPGQRLKPGSLVLGQAERRGAPFLVRRVFGKGAKLSGYGGSRSQWRQRLAPGTAVPSGFTHTAIYLGQGKIWEYRHGRIQTTNITDDTEQYWAMQPPENYDSALATLMRNRLEKFPTEYSAPASIGRQREDILEEYPVRVKYPSRSYCVDIVLRVYLVALGVGQRPPPLSLLGTRYFPWHEWIDPTPSRWGVRRLSDWAQQMGFGPLGKVRKSEDF